MAPPPLRPAAGAVRAPVLALGLVLAGAGGAAGESVYLPEPGLAVVSASAAYETFDRIWLGGELIPLADLGGSRSRYALGSVQAQLALDARWALDASIGYVASRIDGLGAEHGLADSRVGVRWRIRHEGADEAWPSVGVRVGAIVQGTYVPGPIWAPGAGASGGEAALLLGRRFTSGTTLEFDAGGRVRGEGVPEDVFGSVRVGQALGRLATASIGYAHTRGIGGAGTRLGSSIAASDFQGTRVTAGTLWAGLGVDTTRVQYLSLSLGRTLTGRNTGQKTGIAASATAWF